MRSKIAGEELYYVMRDKNMMNKMNHALFGLHLIEILSVMFIACLLSAISLSLYGHHLVHTNRLQAAQSLLELAVAMESYYVEQGSYQGADLDMLHFPKYIAKRSYQLMIQSATREYYQVLASPIGKQAEY